MFYEEKLIGGLLMCRSEPGGEWRPVTVQELTRRLISAMAAQQMLEQDLGAVRGHVRAYYEALDRREHGGVAQDKALRGVQDVLGMEWVQGASAGGTAEG